jgi:signal transduction histidine kinase
MRLGTRFALFALGSAVVLLAAVCVSVVQMEVHYLTNEAREQSVVECAQLASALSAGWKRGRGLLRPSEPILARVLSLPGFSYLTFEDDAGRVRFSSKAEPGITAFIKGGRLDDATRRAVGAAGVLIRSRWRDSQDGSMTEILLPVEGPRRPGLLRLGLRDADIERGVSAFAREAMLRLSLLSGWAFLAYFTLAFLFGRRLEAPYWSLHLRALETLKLLPTRAAAVPTPAPPTELEAISSDLQGLSTAVERLHGSRKDLFDYVDAEFRNRLKKIELNTELALSGAAGQLTPALAGCLKTIRSQGCEFERLFENVMHWVEAEHQLLRVSESRVEVQPLLQAALRAFEDEARQDGILLKGQAPDSGLSFRGDYHGTYLALTNLLSNALRFTPPGGEIRVQASELPSHVQIDVMHTGGIPEKKKSRAKESAGHEGARGLGLGLSVAKALIEAQGGEIAIGSPDGKGAVARLLLPKAQ